MVAPIHPTPLSSLVSLLIRIGLTRTQSRPISFSSITTTLSFVLYNFLNIILKVRKEILSTLVEKKDIFLIYGNDGMHVLLLVNLQNLFLMK